MNVNSLPNNVDMSYDANRANEQGFVSNEHSLIYRQAGRFPDPQPQHSLDPSLSTARPVLHFSQHQDAPNFPHRPYHPTFHHHQDSPIEGKLSDATPMSEVTPLNYDLHVSDTSRGRLPKCTSLDRVQPTQVPVQTQQQYCAKTNPCAPFEQSVYRSTNYSRPMAVMMPSAHSELDSSSIPQHTVSNCKWFLFRCYFCHSTQLPWSCLACLHIELQNECRVSLSRSTFYECLFIVWFRKQELKVGIDTTLEVVANGVTTLYLAGSIAISCRYLEPWVKLPEIPMLY